MLVEFFTLQHISHSIPIILLELALEVDSVEHVVDLREYFEGLRMQEHLSIHEVAQ